MLLPNSSVKDSSAIKGSTTRDLCLLQVPGKKKQNSKLRFHTTSEQKNGHNCAVLFNSGPLFLPDITCLYIKNAM